MTMTSMWSGQVRRGQEMCERLRPMSGRRDWPRVRRVDAWEVAQAGRRHQAQRIMADAAERDDQADARDSVATTRDTAASLHSFINDSPEEFDPAFKARRSAAIDRSKSKTDRAAAAVDRFELTDGDPTAPSAEDDTDHLP